MQLFVVFVILALAVGYALWRIVRTLRGRGDCGCGCGHDCPNRRCNRTDSPCKSCHHRHCDSLTLAALLMLSPLAATAGNVVSQLVNDIRHLPYTELHHLIIIHNGHVTSEVHAMPYRATDPHNQYSASKMFTALAVGLAVEDGKLRLDDKLVDIFPNKLLASPTIEMRAMTVRHLLTMTSGKVVATAIRDTSAHWVENWLALAGTAPGRRFEYDTMTSFILSAVVQQSTGLRILDLLNERILHPMGITDAEWELSPDSINTGGWGLRCSTMSMAKVGQLLLQHGQWNGRQLIDPAWVNQMTTDHLHQLGIPVTHIDEFHEGYGYQMWLCDLPGAYRAQGNQGQFTLVYPDGNLVIAVNCATPCQSDVLHTLQRYAPQIATSIGQQSAAMPGFELYGKQWTHDSLFIKLPENSLNLCSLTVSRRSSNLILTMHYTDDRSESIPLGYTQWIYSRLQHTPPYNIGAQNRFSGMNRGFTVAARYACHIADQLEIRLHFVDWGSSLGILIDRATGRVIINNNKSQNRPEVLTVSDLAIGTRATSKWWIAAFASLFITILALIVCNKPT